MFHSEHAFLKKIPCQHGGNFSMLFKTRTFMFKFLHVQNFLHVASFFACSKFFACSNFLHVHICNMHVHMSTCMFTVVNIPPSIISPAQAVN
jgi:hypothetical protein